ncbi:MAG: CPBP family intramembrane metalloprotease [Gammaproteobacteria bacterium]|nr:CPBP family intramembrane metalloprotease [Gammaproteobacteria bacterium]MCW8923379.1 CPBP family intramembrane metalloprotease [Gammaproteobacteria bacterium]
MSEITNNKIKQFFNLRQHWQQIDADLEIQKKDSDKTIISILLVVTLAIIVTNYYQQFFPAEFSAADDYAALKKLTIWISVILFSYIVLPILAIRFVLKQNLLDYFLTIRGFTSKLPLYLLFYLCILPGLWLASKSSSFTQTYPFYIFAHRSTFDFITWELLYALHFVAVEFIFRGVMLKGLGDYFGHRAIFIMMVPYTLVHIGKPLPEVLGAIVAAIILGTLAMRTRMIWGGVLIHILVALTMDSLAMQYCQTSYPCR